MDSKDVANPLSPIYSRSVPARSSCAPCFLASPQPRHYARQVIQSTVRLAQSTATPRWLHPHQWRRGQIAIEPSALLLLHLTRFLPLALFVRLRSARVDGVVVQASEKLHTNCREHVQHSTGQDARKRTNDGRGRSLWRRCRTGESSRPIVREPRHDRHCRKHVLISVVTSNDSSRTCNQAFRLEMTFPHLLPNADGGLAFGICDCSSKPCVSTDAGRPVSYEHRLA